MQIAVLDEEKRGFEIPKDLRTLAALFAIAVAACLFAAVVVQGQQLGSVIALSFALPMGFLLWQTRKDLWKNNTKRLCALFMFACLASMVYAPGFLNLTLGWVLLVSGAVVLRSETGVEPLQLIGASLRQFAGGIGRGVMDVLRLAAVALHVPAVSLPKVTALLLPMGAGLVFAALLASANPLLEQAVTRLNLDAISQMFDTIFDAATSVTTLWFMLFFASLWPTLRGRAVAKPWSGEASVPVWHSLFFKPNTVIATLLLLNLMFAGQNLLDLSFVWSDAKLPAGMTHAQYVHRGSYTLIATALLAAALIMFILRKGSATEQSRRVQWLVHLWTAQNLFLVASSAKRTLAYINDYGWTEWRVSGLIWMALVFFGLATIIVRVVKNHDTRWLMNTNLIASFVVLLAMSAWNMQGFIAEKNLDRRLADPTKSLDSGYLYELGTASLPALMRAKQAEDSGKARYVNGFTTILSQNVLGLKAHWDTAQSDWRSWTIANALITLPPEPVPAMNRDR
jgi:hypothetical protein